MTDKADKLPQCQRVYARESGAIRRCTRAGFACWVSGEFGREAKVLCMSCINTLRRMGWTVRYMIEGDNPAPLNKMGDI